MKYLRDETGAALVIELVVLAIVLAAAGFAGYQYLSHKTAASKPTPTQSPDAYAGWLTYHSSTISGLSFKYPSNWKLQSQGIGAEPDHKVLTSPNNTDINFTPGYLTSIGGEYAAPYSNKVTSAEALPHAPGLYLVVTSSTQGSQQNVMMGVMDENELGHAPVVGDSIAFPSATSPNYFWFKEKSDKTRFVDFEVNGYDLHSQDQATAKLILESLTY